ncbi:MAG: DUF6526 family protein [Gemmatimonadaceae bacterium]
MPEQLQTYASHRRYIPHFHFFVLPVLVANVIIAIVRFWRAPQLITGWAIVVAIALLLGLFTARSMALRAQDRIIRFEERVRLERLLPSDLRGRIDELSAGQLIALRFAPDVEVTDLTRRALAGELKRQGDIKRAIRNWRADHLRV